MERRFRERVRLPMWREQREQRSGDSTQLKTRERGEVFGNAYRVRPGEPRDKGTLWGMYRWVLGTTEGSSPGVAAHLPLQLKSALCLCGGSLQGNKMLSGSHGRK